MKQLRDAPIKGKDILLIADFNTEITGNLPSCTFKIDQVLPTIREIVKMDSRSLTIVSHMGRPENREEYSMWPIYSYLITKVDNIKYESIMEYLANGKAMLLENSIQMVDNMRYYNEEDLNRFYNLFDTVINDAFGSSHRDLRMNAYAGLLMFKEVKALSEAKHADLVIMGGSKIKEKLKIVEHFRGLVYLGGCLAITVLKNLGYEMGKYSKTEECDCLSLKNKLITIEEFLNNIPKNNHIENKHETEEKDCVDTFREQESKQKKKVTSLKCSLSSSQGLKANKDSTAKKCDSLNKIYKNSNRLGIMLPIDFFVIEHTNNKQNCKVKQIDEIETNDECTDIGPKSMEQLRMLIEKSKSVFWNGPIGKTRVHEAGSTEILIKILEEYKGETFLGGGETVSSIVQYSKIENFTHVSTGGGAMLKFLAGFDMPGISTVMEKTTSPSEAASSSIN
ncbi:phosphoglycerate kinase [Pancytospora epiphaga]|nr:phosphoglycerate kinase [Pancytospora epiphaga]